jgi:hypothetical protein
MQLRASVSQFIYPFSKPDTHTTRSNSLCERKLIIATLRAEQFGSSAQIASDLLKNFASNHRKLKGTTTNPSRLNDTGVFDFAAEKYESDSSGLLPFRTPTKEEQSISTNLQSPHRKDSLRITPNVPMPVEVYEEGLGDLVQINKDWETFLATNKNVQCERLSETEFQVSWASRWRLTVGDYVAEAGGVCYGDNSVDSSTIKGYNICPRDFLSQSPNLRPPLQHPKGTLHPQKA